jgi:hypothetical protein
MTEPFGLRPDPDTKRKLHSIDKKIQARVSGCFTSHCWLLKDEKDIGRIYLKKLTTTEGREGRYVYIRRYLFLSTYGHLPCYNIKMLCENEKLCVNPAHATYQVFKREWAIVEALIEKGYITREDAEEMYKK